MNLKLKMSTGFAPVYRIYCIECAEDFYSYEIHENLHEQYSARRKRLLVARASRAALAKGGDAV